MDYPAWRRLLLDEFHVLHWACGCMDFDDVGGWGEVGDVEGGGVAEGGGGAAGHVEELDGDVLISKALYLYLARGGVGIDFDFCI